MAVPVTDNQIKPIIKGEFFLGYNI
jgi:hypothetical protein